MDRDQLTLLLAKFFLEQFQEDATMIYEWVADQEADIEEVYDGARRMVVGGSGSLGAGEL